MKDIQALTSAAMLEALWENNHTDMLDLVSPFIKYSLNKQFEIGDRIDIHRVAVYVEDNFAYNHFPDAVVSKTLKRFSPKFVKRENGEYYLKTSFADDVSNLMDRKARCSRDIDEIGKVLFPYLELHCRKTKFDSKESAIQALSNFLSKYSVHIGQDTLALETVSSKEYEVDYYIARFIIEQEENNNKEYYGILNLVKGYFLSTALYLQVDNNNLLTASYKNISFYYDTPFLIRLLGFCSKEEQNSAMELHNTLVKQGGKFYYFNHTADEIGSILTAYQHSLTDRTSTRTLKGLDELGYSFSGVERLKRNYQSRLKKEFSIFIHPVPPLKQNEDGTVDVNSVIPEAELKDFIRKYVKYNKEEALNADISSALSIDRLRDRVVVKEIESCRAIFVTTNGTFTRAFNFYYDRNVFPDTFPLVISDMDLSALTWVKNASTNNEIPKVQLLANAYMAMQVPAEVTERFYKIVGQMKNENTITAEEAFLLRTSHYVERELNYSTMGDVNDISESLVLDLHEKYKEEIILKVKNEYEQKQRKQQRKYKRREKEQENKFEKFKMMQQNKFNEELLKQQNEFKEEMYEMQRRNAREKIEECCNLAREDARKSKNIFIRIWKIVRVFISLMFFVASLPYFLSGWIGTSVSIALIIYITISLFSYFDTINSKIVFFDKPLMRFANSFETHVYESKKKKYFKKFGIIAEDMADCYEI